MAVQITIRNVPEKVRDALAARAAKRNQSMQGFILEELEKIVSKPSKEDLLERIRQRKEVTNTNVSAATILRAREADRK